MIPGRELDKRIAIEVMGLENVRYTINEGSNYLCYGPIDQFYPFVVPDYSTRIKDAWDVVEKLQRWHFSLEKLGPILESVSSSGYEFIVTMRSVLTKWGDNRAVSYISAPHAICLSALKTVEND